KYLLSLVLQHDPQPGGGIATVPKPGFFQYGGLLSFAQLHCSGDGDGFGMADAFDFHQFFYRQIAEALEVVPAQGEDIPGKLDGVTVRGAGTDENGQELRIAQGTGAFTE